MAFSGAGRRGAIFLTAPIWVAAGYLVVLAWSAFMLYLVFYRKDQITQNLEELFRKGGDRSF